jgi:hypothetical protein
MKDCLIICPVGRDMTFHDAYDKNQHWRYTNKIDRLYETLIVIYNDWLPKESNTFDQVMVGYGHKWNLVQWIARTQPDLIKQYRYIGCFDDDLITDIEAVNTLVARALHMDWRLAQLSMLKGSGAIYRCTQQNPDWSIAETNFIEMGSPIFRQDTFLELMKFMGELGPIEIGWGIDKCFCLPGVLAPHHITAGVVHSHSIYHPHFSIKPSYYDQNKAMQEMHQTLARAQQVVESRGHKWQFIDQQCTIWAYSNIGKDYYFEDDHRNANVLHQWSGRSGMQ